MGLEIVEGIFVVISCEHRNASEYHEDDDTDVPPVRRLVSPPADEDLWSPKADGLDQLDQVSSGPAGDAPNC